jgi:ubiquinone/menaquinone biosynthesis C-methylase UbiE
MPAGATAANLKAFDTAWTARTQFVVRFRYNIEAARKEFLALLSDLRVSRTRQRVLDAGFGSGMLMFQFDRKSVIRGVEISTSALAAAKQRARRGGYVDAEFVRPENETRLPFDDRTFSVVIASHVVEHVEDDIGFVRELLRVLRPDGWLFVIGPLDNPADGLLSDEALANPAFAEGHYHVRNYNAESLVRRIEQAGGTVERARLSMATWDWKVRADPWRSRLSRSLPGRIVDRGIAAALNLPLSLMPLTCLRAVDRFFVWQGYHPRQAALAVRRRS